MVLQVHYSSSKTEAFLLLTTGRAT